MKFDKDITKIKRVTFFLRHSVDKVFIWYTCFRLTDVNFLPFGISRAIVFYALVDAFILSFVVYFFCFFIFLLYDCFCINF